MQNKATYETLAMFKMNKESRQNLAQEIVNKVLDGQIEPLQLQLQIKCLEEICDLIKSDPYYNHELLTSAEKYGKTFDYQLAKISVKEVGVKYDYSKCNDPKLSQFEQKATTAAEFLNSHQKYLQKVPLEGITQLDEETGEKFTVYPPSKSSKTSVVFQLF